MSETERKKHFITHSVSHFEKKFVESVQKSYVEGEFHDLIITNEARNIKYAEIKILFSFFILKHHMSFVCWQNSSPSYCHRYKNPSVQRLFVGQRCRHDYNGFG